MPLGGFVWRTAAVLQRSNWLGDSEEQMKGYFIEESGNYPAELQ